MARSPRVLHVITSVDVGGAENHLLSLVDGLDDRGYEVTIAYLKGDGELADEFRDAGCSVERIGIRADVDPVGFWRLVRLVRAGDYDLIHTHLYHGDVYGTAAASLAGVPAVVASKHNDPPYWGQQPWRALHDMTLARDDAVITISDSVQSHLLETSSAHPSGVRTIRYGLDPEPFDTVDPDAVASVRSEFAPPDAPLVGSIGRLTEQKDYPTLLRAFARLRTESDGRAADARLAIVGRGERRDALASLAADLGVDDAVTFAGFRTDVPELVCAFDAFALTSRWEGFGVVFLEAMAAATPVVASRTSAIPEVVADGETGLLADPGDVEAFAAHLDRLLDDPDTAAAFGQRGRERLDSQFTVARMVDETVALYDEVLPEDRSPD